MGIQTIWWAKKSLKTTAALLHCEVGDDAKSIRSHPFIEPLM